MNVLSLISKIARAGVVTVVAAGLAGSPAGANSFAGVTGAAGGWA